VTETSPIEVGAEGTGAEGTGTEGADSADTVLLTVPADSAYVSVLRTVTASLAARRDFTLDEIDDLRIAIDEACALLLPLAGDDGTGRTLTARFSGPPEILTTSVTLSDPPTDAGPDRTSFAWLVLVAVAENVRTELSPDGLCLRFDKARGPRD
jgi:serine/threonine-protein kinase RsbW